MSGRKLTIQNSKQALCQTLKMPEIALSEGWLARFLGKIAKSGVPRIANFGVPTTSVLFDPSQNYGTLLQLLGSVTETGKPSVPIRSFCDSARGVHYCGGTHHTLRHTNEARAVIFPGLIQNQDSWGEKPALKEPSMVSTCREEVRVRHRHRSEKIMLEQKEIPTIDQAEVARRWPDFTPLELEQVCESIVQLRGGLQQKYGLSADEAARQMQQAYPQIATISEEESEAL
ncbi:hypothetical protein KOR42_25430 [Thalassoglobus neptunius]|uniref:Uncharacterized protein n=1 Tax=Thalassoglobus neptunius TaxID=1938619 RepID=A0A5C5X8E7_9PLAN|nr:hypothetical protein [Thalassoglobus neptunius]TWT59154.1 hypothetical protein KOR42_25430 [Thalassoglobus neptunius]